MDVQNLMYPAQGLSVFQMRLLDWMCEKMISFLVYALLGSWQKKHTTCFSQNSCVEFHIVLRQFCAGQMTFGVLLTPGSGCKRSC